MSQSQGPKKDYSFLTNSLKKEARCNNYGKNSIWL